jgi:Uma2 family endonuclease
VADMVLENQLREFTVSEFHRMAEAGIIGEDERVELLDGQIIQMVPVGVPHWNRHATIVSYLNDMLRGRAIVVGQGSFPLGVRSEPKPDVAVLAPRLYELDGRPPRSHEIFALVELAESSLATDLGPKLKVYARHSIRDYLVVDLDDDRLLHHTDPREVGYDTLATLGSGDTFVLTAILDVVLSTAPFLRPSR